MIPEALHPVVALTVTFLVFVVLQLRRGAPTDFLFLAGLLAVTLAGVISPEEAFQGFASPALLTVAGLLVISAGLRLTGVLDWVGHALLGGARTERQALFRLAPTLVGASAFLLNTAVVAMMMPVVLDWCRKHQISPSRLLIPLSYLVILGGVCTLIGTSTTLVVNGLLREAQQQRMADLREVQTAANRPEGEAQASDVESRLETFIDQIRPLSLFELGWIGVPCSLVGTIYLLLIGSRLLPRRIDIAQHVGESRREYLVEMLVTRDCPLVGRTVEQAGLRQLPGLFLIEITRGEETITPVAPEDRLHAGDRLTFTGIVSTIVDLEKVPGLIPAADLSYELQPEKRQARCLTEVVLSRTSPLIGTTVKEANFRQRYNAAVIAVHRNGLRLTNKIGNIMLEPGDTLLLQTRAQFVDTYRNSREFYLVSPVDGAEIRLHNKRYVAAGLALILVIWLCLASLLAQYGLPEAVTSPAVASLAIAILMIVTRCVRASEARPMLDLQLLVTIAAALGLGRAIEASGAARQIAEVMVALVGHHPQALLVVILALTMLFTETITNNAVAAMLLPIAMAVAWEGGFDPRPFIITITLAASLSFITPIGYQTNLMVMGPGGYRPYDYLRCGLPLALIMAGLALTLIPRIWTF